MQDMIKLIHQLSFKHNTSRIFSDFLEMSAIAISNGINKRQFEEREKRYFEIIKNYSNAEIEEISKLLGMLVNHLEENPRDVLGELFHALSLHNVRQGQFFTPSHVSRFMAAITVGEAQQEIINKYGFMRLSEPACGMGSMVIAAALELKKLGLNYQHVIHTTAVDLDPVCVHGTYIQLSLLHIPAVVIHGNSLSLEEFSHWYTPAHILGFWNQKLERRRQISVAEEFIVNQQAQKNDTTTTEHKNNERTRKPDKGTQLTMF